MEKLLAGREKRALKAQSIYPAFVAVAAVAFALVVIYMFVLPDFRSAGNGSAVAPDVPRGIELFSDREVYLEGQAAEITARGSSETIELTVDGKPVESKKSGGTFRASVVLSPGSHEIVASDGRSRARIIIVANRRECQEGENKTCALSDGCRGTATCDGGKFGSCARPESVCLPGSKIGCVIGSCTTGAETCDRCGSGYGPCLAGS